MTGLEYEILSVALRFIAFFIVVAIFCAVGLYWLGPEDDD